MATTPTELHGVLVIDKPAGMTSAAVVARARKVLGAKGIGHTGTLDPLATGVLPLVLGEGTKLATFLLADDKEYDVELELGVTTDTLDADGAVIDRRPAGNVDEVALRCALAGRSGTQLQVPPMYSAIKHDGRRLYDLARRGEEVERERREVRIDQLALLSFTPPRARLHVACSKGTYVRSLVRDLGEDLGCGATVTALRRTRAGRFSLAEALPLADLTPALAAARLVALPQAVAHLPVLPLDDAAVARVAQGQRLPTPVDVAEGTVMALITPAGALAALAAVTDGKLAYLRVFNYGLPRNAPPRGPGT